MKELFQLDIRDYDNADATEKRPSARAVIRTENHELAMVYSRKYRYYKFPGGGIHADENKEEALAREILEETGLVVKKDTIQEYGSVRVRQKSSMREHAVFEQENFYYFCSVEEGVRAQKLDDYEKESEFELQYVEGSKAIAANKACAVQNDFDHVMVARDTKVLERLCGMPSEPSEAMADFLLRAAAVSNPGPWEQHSRYVADCAKRIAGRCPGLDPERAYVYGMLHDIGRKFGVSGLAHVYDGYHYLRDLGYDHAARIALSHSFNRKTLSDYIGAFDIPKSAQSEIEALLDKMEYDDYDYLIQLCDSIAKADGIVSLEERMNDVKSRYGRYPQEKWDRNMELKAYFEEKMQAELYPVVREA